MTITRSQVQFQPTPEQETIRDWVTDHPSDGCKIVAYAGTGKTSTLQLLAKANSRRGLYFAFNKAIQEEAASKFPRHIACRTSHALAFRAMDMFNMSKRRKLDLPSGQRAMVDILDINTADEDGLALARCIKDTLHRYMCSAEKVICAPHIPKSYLYGFDVTNEEPKKRKLGEARLKNFVSLVISGSNIIWDAMTDPDNDEIGMAHDVYLKQWQLSEPILKYAVMFLDEAQDSNPVLLDIVRRQTSPVILVGDQYQSIYAFRGAINAMANAPGEELYLTKSFRFGDNIAAVANSILELHEGFADKPPLKGFESIKDSIGQVDTDKPHTILCRSNAGVFGEALSLAEHDTPFCVVGGIRDATTLLRSGHALYLGDTDRVTHPSLFPYKSWHELSLEVDSGDADSGIKTLHRRVTDYGNAIPAMCDMLEESGAIPEKEAHVVLSTAHKSKGREWHNVILADDFYGLQTAIEKAGEDDEYPINPQEINLLYVAATRAERRLELNTPASMLAGHLMEA